MLLGGDSNARTGSVPDYTDAGVLVHCTRKDMYIFKHGSLYSSPLVNKRDSPI